MEDTGREWGGAGQDGDVTGHDWANCCAGAFLCRRVFVLARFCAGAFLCRRVVVPARFSGACFCWRVCPLARFFCWGVFLPAPCSAGAFFCRRVYQLRRLSGKAFIWRVCSGLFVLFCWRVFCWGVCLLARFVLLLRVAAGTCFILLAPFCLLARCSAVTLLFVAAITNFTMEGNWYLWCFDKGRPTQMSQRNSKLINYSHTRITLLYNFILHVRKHSRHLLVILMKRRASANFTAAEGEGRFPTAIATMSLAHVERTPMCT